MVLVGCERGTGLTGGSKGGSREEEGELVGKLG